ncbi:hypothetical protein JCM10908_000320 [Rhodotorula pacifica]|uniref:uncharacterized protein n=1 Tax=Rhodotorula pacifica TaxID=1495444 RepID=UPI00316C4FF4
MSGQSAPPPAGRAPSTGASIPLPPPTRRLPPTVPQREATARQVSAATTARSSTVQVFRSAVGKKRARAGVKEDSQDQDDSEEDAPPGPRRSLRSGKGKAAVQPSTSSTSRSTNQRRTAAVPPDPTQGSVEAGPSKRVRIQSQTAATNSAWRRPKAVAGPRAGSSGVARAAGQDLRIHDLPTLTSPNDGTDAAGTKVHVHEYSDIELEFEMPPSGQKSSSALESRPESGSIILPIQKDVDTGPHNASLDATTQLSLLVQALTPGTSARMQRDREAALNELLEHIARTGALALPAEALIGLQTRAGPDLGEDAGLKGGDAVEDGEEGESIQQEGRARVTGDEMDEDDEEATISASTRKVSERPRRNAATRARGSYREDAGWTSEEEEPDRAPASGPTFGEVLGDLGMTSNQLRTVVKTAPLMPLSDARTVVQQLPALPAALPNDLKSARPAQLFKTLGDKIDLFSNGSVAVPSPTAHRAIIASLRVIEDVYLRCDRGKTPKLSGLLNSAEKKLPEARQGSILCEMADKACIFLASIYTFYRGQTAGNGASDLKGKTFGLFIDFALIAQQLPLDQVDSRDIAIRLGTTFADWDYNAKLRDLSFLFPPRLAAKQCAYATPAQVHVHADIVAIDRSLNAVRQHPSYQQFFSVLDAEIKELAGKLAAAGLHPDDAIRFTIRYQDNPELTANLISAWHASKVSVGGFAPVTHGLDIPNSPADWDILNSSINVAFWSPVIHEYLDRELKEACAAALEEKSDGSSAEGAVSDRKGNILTGLASFCSSISRRAGEEYALQDAQHLAAKSQLVQLAGSHYRTQFLPAAHYRTKEGLDAVVDLEQELPKVASLTADIIGLEAEKVLKPLLEFLRSQPVLEGISARPTVLKRPATDDHGSSARLHWRTRQDSYSTDCLTIDFPHTEAQETALRSRPQFVPDPVIEMVLERQYPPGASQEAAVELSSYFETNLPWTPLETIHSHARHVERYTAEVKAAPEQFQRLRNQLAAARFMLSAQSNAVSFGRTFLIAPAHDCVTLMTSLLRKLETRGATPAEIDDWSNFIVDLLALTALSARPAATSYLLPTYMSSQDLGVDFGDRMTQRILSEVVVLFNYASASLVVQFDDQHRVTPRGVDSLALRSYAATFDLLSHQCRCFACGSALFPTPENLPTIGNVHERRLSWTTSGRRRVADTAVWEEDELNDVWVESARCKCILPCLVECTARRVLSDASRATVSLLSSVNHRNCKTDRLRNDAVSVLPGVTSKPINIGVLTVIASTEQRAEDDEEEEDEECFHRAAIYLLAAKYERKGQSRPAEEHEDGRDSRGLKRPAPHVIEIFALFMLLGLIVSIWATPETKGKTLEELSGEDQDNFLQPTAPAGHARV